VRAAKGVKEALRVVSCYHPYAKCFQRGEPIKTTEERTDEKFLLKACTLSIVAAKCSTPLMDVLIIGMLFGDIVCSCSLQLSPVVQRASDTVQLA
jgi:hypothetical protein